MALTLSLVLHHAPIVNGKPVFPPISFPFGDMVEQLFVGQLLAVTGSTKMFHLDTPTLLDDLVGLGLELNHWWRVSGNVIGSPHFGVNDTV